MTVPTHPDRHPSMLAALWIAALVMWLAAGIAWAAMAIAGAPVYGTLGMFAVILAIWLTTPVILEARR